MIQHQNRDRTDIWLPLLRRLSEVCPNWLVWKNAESAFTGTGDIDSAAPDSDWGTIEREFRAWAAEQEIGPAVVCRHIPGGLNLVAVPVDGSTLLEVGVKANKLWRGSILFVLDDLLPLVEWDDRGFRRLRPGAEGLLKLLLNGVRWDGAPNREGLRDKGVIELLNRDPEGARLVTRRFGAVRGLLITAADRAAAGQWDRTAMLAVQAWAFAAAARRPGVTLARARFLALNRMGLPFTQRTRCPVVAALDNGRRIPPDRASWLRHVAANHTVYDDTAALRRNPTTGG
jgi:hypothetical protein